jgi:phytol kinase
MTSRVDTINPRLQLTLLTKDVLTMAAPSPARRRVLYCAILLLVTISHASGYSFQSATGLTRKRNQNARTQLALGKQTDHDERLSITKSNPSSQRGAVLTTALGSLSTVALAAKVGFLGEYTDAAILQDVGAGMFCGVAGFVYVKLISWLASKEILEPRDSRKLIHTGSAPLYMLFWPLFSPSGRFFAAIVPLVNGVRLYLAAKGQADESELARAVSRSGDIKEALGGPFLYVIIMLSCILLFWTDSCAGIFAMSIMAAGDGMADIVGRRLGSNNKWFFSPNKSIAGSVAFWVSGTAVSIGISTWLSSVGVLTLPMPMSELAPQIAWITAACALIELLPIGDDNWTVPLSAALFTVIFVL